MDTTLNRLLLSSLISRHSIANDTTYGGLRDVWTALGYPSDGTLGFNDFWLRYKRQDIAAAVIEKPVEGSWRQLPVISGSDRLQNQWMELENELGIYRTLVRADTMSRIGQYSALLIGFADGNLEEEVTASEGLLYVQPYLQKHAEIKSYVSDPSDPRFGLPEIYQLTLDEGEKNTTAQVHHSRVIHIADNLVESNVFGEPALERIFNRLLNLELIVGGSAEMFWRGAFPGLAFSVQDGANLTDAGKTELEEEIQKYLHDFQRYLKLQGLDVNQLSVQIADPSNHADLQLKAISIATGIPKRILEGSERGELASSQDSESWDSKCDYRRRNHCEANILRPFIDRLMTVGVLDSEEYKVEWPDLESVSDEQKAIVGKARTEAIAKYADSPTAPLVVGQREFLSDILELPEEKVERIMDVVGETDLAMPDNEEPEEEP